MKKLILLGVAAINLQATAATSQVADDAITALNNAHNNTIQRAPAQLRDSIGQAQNQWSAWASQDCKVRNGLAIGQAYSLYSEPFGSCMIDQMQRRTAQLNSQTKQ